MINKWILLMLLVSTILLLGDVAQWLESEFKTKDPVFDPMMERNEGQFFCNFESTLVKPCLCLTSLRVYSTHPKLCSR